MRSRCNCKSDAGYHRYGGRGIKIDRAWDFYPDFRKWCFANGGGDNDLQLDRIDNNGNYSPENCRIVTRTENNNNRRSSIFIEYKGMKMTQTKWAQLFGINDSHFWKLVNTREFSMEEIEKYAIENRGYKPVEVSK